jgi:hypothetical protein
MFKTVGFAFAVCAVGILTIAWSQTKGPLQPAPQLVETISPESLMVGIGLLPVSKFNDMSLVFTDN